MKKSLVSIILISCFLISCKDNQLEKKEQVLKTTNGEINFIEPKKIQSNKKLEEFLKSSFYSVEEIDFTGDKILDFICRAKPNSNRQGTEYWINSNFKIIRQNAYYLDGFTHRRFANLDKDIEPEIFENFVKFTFSKIRPNYFITHELYFFKSSEVLLYRPFLKSFSDLSILSLNSFIDIGLKLGSCSNSLIDFFFNKFSN